MIFDRTQSDVNFAKNIRETKLKKFSTLSDSDISVLEKGFFTLNTINRIENKQKELKQLLNTLGYLNISIVNKTWALGDDFSENDFQRIIDNENLLRESFFVYSYTPATPGISFYFEDINSLEKILYDIENMIDDVKNNYRICGTFECGE